MNEHSKRAEEAKEMETDKTKASHVIGASRFHLL